MAEKNLVFVLSDIHIGNNAPTVWYQQEFHEPYLMTALEFIIKMAPSVKKLILMGDIFDFWLYPPDDIPPTIDDIIKANPNILGSGGKFDQVLTALDGNVTYLYGNHDLPYPNTLTQADLDQIPSSSGYHIKLGPPIYREEQSMIYFTHGHHFTIFDAPDPNTELNPLPVCYFISRAYAYYLKTRVLGPGDTVADFPNQGNPNGLDLGNFMKSLNENIAPDVAVTDLLLDYIADISGLPKDTPIKLPGGKSKTIMDAKALYKKLWGNWVAAYGGGVLGRLAAYKSAYADYDGTYLPWFAQKEALETGGDLMVMGHTHIPKLHLKEAMIDYMNTGFMCPSKKDISTKPPTFGYVDLNTTTPYLLKVINTEDDIYKVQPYEAEADTIVYKPNQDYSCYVWLDNYNSGETLKRQGDPVAQHGYYVVSPPAEIPFPGQARFWILDYPGAVGSQGQVTYNTMTGPVTYSYTCPVAGSNNCAPTDCQTKSDGGNWQEGIVKNGHPFFINFLESLIVALEWAPNRQYQLGEYVFYLQSGLYRCIQAHTSVPGLEPPNAPSYWVKIYPLQVQDQADSV